MRNWIWRLFAFLGLRRGRSDGFRGVAVVDSAADPRREIGRGKLVLIGSAERPKWLRFRCPCGCGGTVSLNLMGSHTPRWTFEQHPDNTLSVRPSVDATACGSHYWIRGSRVVWV
jgi:hypothetical protein